LLEGSFSEKRGKGAQALLNMVGSGRNLDQCLCGIRERGISIPFAHKWLKSSSQSYSDTSVLGRASSTSIMLSQSPSRHHLR
jgi:hypothetical protein